MKFIVTAYLAVALFGVGCAGTRPTFEPEMYIPVEIRPTSYVTISEARAVRQDGRVLVSGSLRRPGDVRLPGHVDVLFLGPDGSLLYEHKIKVAGLDSKRGGVQGIPFTATLDLELPAGATAVFTNHAPPF